MKRCSTTVVALLLMSVLAAAQSQRGALIRVASLYLSPDSNSSKLGEVTRGREVIILETSGNWLHVEANLAEEKTVSGWVQDKGVVRASTPNGDRVLFGEAVESEDQASQRHGRRDAAQDAMRLYYRTAEYFPSSPLAGEAMYRSADIRWQIDREDVKTLPSSREQAAYLRPEIEDHFMKEVIKKFPGTKWADLAAFRLLDNKVCGDWQGQSKCPVKEAEMYENYVKEHPQSPANAEALYDAASRWAALIEIYKTETQPKKSEEAKSKAIATAQTAATQFPQSDWGARAQRLLFLVQEGVPTYGNALE